MNLKLTSNDAKVFEIYDQDQMIINIKIDKYAKAFRVTCKERKRVFFVEEGDAKNNLDVIINEYSQPLGFIKRLADIKNSGSIETEGLKYTYTISITSKIEIMLYTNYESNPVITCSIEKDSGFDINGIEVKYILFSLTWFLFLNTVKKESLEYAEV